MVRRHRVVKALWSNVGVTGEREGNRMNGVVQSVVQVRHRPGAIGAAFTPADVEQFRHDGFLIVRGLADAASCERMLAVAHRHLEASMAPVEYEADTQYPGAPATLDAPGGRTVRRLLQAYARDPLFRDWVHAEALVTRLEQLLEAPVALSQVHHNCVMTKQPAFSSVTGWHQDIRYWSYSQPDLVSVWLALGPEHVDNGCLFVVPGSHRMVFGPDQYDEAQFFRADTDQNRAVLACQTPVELEPGDVLFFHARLLHAAGRNHTDRTKFAAAFTFHASNNRPVAGTRSASLPDVAI